MTLWKRTVWAMWAAGLLVGGVAHAQDTGSAQDIKTACFVSAIPALEEISVSWTGDCVGGMADGVGNVLAFSRGDIRYILRGQFTGGRLVRRDQFVPCAGDACTDQVPAAVLREHAALARQRQTQSVPSAAAVVASASRPDIRSPDAVYRGNFSVDPKSGAVSGDGRVEFFDGRQFVGRLEQGRKTGVGTYVWADGQRYVGDWLNDVQDGAGEWTSASGDRYVGTFRGGRREGKGVMSYANKSTYSGDWQADLPHGKGKLSFPTGDVYEGDFVAGERTGSGTLVHQNGDRYTGQWLRGERDGKGLAEWKNGQRYEGEWRKDRKEGVGNMRFPDGNAYEGPWRDDRANGVGSLKFMSGDAYEGEVRDGQPHGKGVYTWGSGDKFDGVFEAGKPTTNGVMTFLIDTPGATPANPSPPTATGEASGAAASTVSKANLCSRAFNSARSISALRRFLETYPEDECGRHALARQKMAAYEESERKQAKDQEDRSAQAKALIGLVVAYRQDYPFCVSGSGSNCQRAVYVFEVKGKIKDIDLARQGVHVQVTEVVPLGNEKGVAAALFAEGRAAATESFRSRVLGTSQWKSKTDLGLSF